MSTLPANWITTRLEDVCEILDRLRVPVNAEQRAERSGNVPYYGATGQVGWIDQALFNEELVLLGEDGAPFLDASKPKAYVVSGPSWVNNHAHVLRALGSIPNKFIAYQLNTVDYHGVVTGTTRLKLPQGPMRGIQLRLPPLAEQRRIVAALEEHLSRLDAAVAGLERVRAQLPRYRAAVLTSVVATAMAGTRTRLSTIGAELREPLRNGHSAKESHNGSGLRTLTLTAVTKGDFSLRNTKLTVADPAKVTDLWLEPGDLLIERSNTPELVGTARLYNGPRGFAIFPDLLIRARVGNGLLPRYVEAVLNAPSSRRYLRGAAQGIAGSMPKISQGTIEAMAIPVPPIEVQQELLAEADQRLSVCEATERAATAILQRSVASRQSILRRAFAGQLVPQDPHDEPASVFLERIRAERAALPVRPKSSERRRAAR